MSSTHLRWERKTVLTQTDLAKYPFVPEAGKFIESLDVKTDELGDPHLERILNRAEARVEKAIRSRLAEKQSAKNEVEIDDVEIPSFPIAVMMVAASANSHLKRRFALSEAKRVSNSLKDEDGEKIIAIARNFDWKIKPVKFTGGPLTYNFVLHFPDFLRNAATIQDEKWKLVNRLMLNGEVYLTKNEAARLLEEEVRRYIERKLNTEVGTLSKSIMDRVDRLKRLFNEMRGKIQFEEVPKDVVFDAFPPCIRELRNSALAGRHISHIGRFALTSFLINSGMTVENVVDCFRPASDFSERMTRYQVEHIAGGRGSRTKYIPPRCDTLRTHGVCPGMDEICRKGVRHPLGYYRRKLRLIKTQASAAPERT